MSDPDLYQKLVLKFQSPAEREAEVRSKGWGKTLESSLMRGEARLGKIAPSATGDSIPESTSTSPAAHSKSCGVKAIDFTVANLVDEQPATKEEGHAVWDAFLRERFVRGEDDDFDYGKVDENEDLDSLEQMDREEAYFDEEEPEWADDSDLDETNTGLSADDGDMAERQRTKRERILLGQTGVQDF